MHKITTLEDENLKFKQQIDHLQKQLQAEMSEKEQSSQNYKVYAQQCNTELERLNVEVGLNTFESTLKCALTFHSLCILLYK